MSQAVDGFVDGAITAADDEQIAFFLDGLNSELGGAVGRGSSGEFGGDARSGEDTASIFNFGEARAASAPAGGIVDEQRIAEIWHGPRTIRNRRDWPRANDCERRIV